MEMHPADQELSKAQFLDFLRDHYGITTGLYSGLWQRFQSDLASQARDYWAHGGAIAFITPEGIVKPFNDLNPNGRQ